CPDRPRPGDGLRPVRPRLPRPPVPLRGPLPPLQGHRTPLPPRRPARPPRRGQGLQRSPETVGAGAGDTGTATLTVGWGRWTSPRGRKRTREPARAVTPGFTFQPPGVFP